MRVVVFCHSLRSDWNHGNAHFLRGVVAELLDRGVAVRVFEPSDAWSVQHLLADHGPAALDRFDRVFPQLARALTVYDPATLDLDAALDGADLVLVHEWTDPALARRVSDHRKRGGRYRALFHDTHHRIVTDPSAFAAFGLEQFDGVLAFGETVTEAHRRRGWARRAWTWHEAADTRVFFPRSAAIEGDVVWVGNWGDEERTAELHAFLLDPARDLGLTGRVHGVRYPSEAIEAVRAAGLRYRGYLPNDDVPATFAAFRVTVHVPRRAYVRQLPGVPTIRVFEALACAIPLVSAPWNDAEGLFEEGDFLRAPDGGAMRARLRDVVHDPSLARAVAAQGRARILARHTCAHRVDELLRIYATLEPGHVQDAVPEAGLDEASRRSTVANAGAPLARAGASRKGA